MTINHDTEYIELCKSMIAQKLNWRPADEWRNYEFTELSEKILDDTQVNLSPTTLKRIFGKLKYDSLPSSATLNALAIYLGFESWMDFKSRQTVDQKIGKHVVTTAKKKLPLKVSVWPAAAAVTIVTIVIVAFSFLSGKSSPAIKNENSIVFSSRPLGDGLPNSVIFNVDLKGNTPGKAIIQQYWDSTRTVSLQPGQKEATGIYYFPGYFRAKLILDGRIIKEHDLFIRADQWMATIDHQPVPTYIKKEDLLTNGKIEVGGNVLKAVKEMNKPSWLTYHLVRPFGGLQSDNFSLKASIRNIYGEDPAVCKTAKIFVLCSKGAFIVPFTIPGCVSDINLKANDNYLPGKSNDLSSLSADLSDWKAVKIEIKDRVLKIFLNDKLVRQEKYKDDAGEVVGLRFGFLGAGAVSDVCLKDGMGETVFEDRFNH